MAEGVNATALGRPHMPDVAAVERALNGTLWPGRCPLSTSNVSSFLFLNVTLAHYPWLLSNQLAAVAALVVGVEPRVPRFSNAALHSQEVADNGMLGSEGPLQAVYRAF